MKMYLFFEALLLLLFLCAATELKAELSEQICSDITLTSPVKMEFSQTEKTLICNEIGSKPWSVIPKTQKEFFLKSFFEARGYFSPTFRHDDKMTYADTGRVSVIREIILENAPFEINPREYWPAYGRALTPKLLDEIEQWILKKLGRNGFPCATLTTRADPKTEIVTIKIGETKRQFFPNITAESIPNTFGGVERRYDAFYKGEPFDSLLLDLTSQRIINDEIVVSNNFTVECTKSGELESIHHNIMPGEPRLLTVGFGFDTEEYAIFEAGWKHTRFTSLGSSFDSYTRLSYRVQTARLGFNWYYVPIVMRHYIRSTIEFERQNEKQYDSRELRGKVGPAWAFDPRWFAINLWVSPTFLHTEILRGEGPSTTDAMSLNVTTDIKTHDFEYYSQDPRSGIGFDLSVDAAKKGMASDYSASKYSVRGTYLLTLFNYDPPIWILGVRTLFAATVIGKDTTENEIPPSMLQRLGGTSDLRGFPRNSIPNDGALTSLYGGTELRINNILPYGFQPILFVDAGRTGPNEFTLDESTYWSPGTGIHWQSIIGTIRGTAAHGYISGEDKKKFPNLEAWQFYFSYGTQF